MVDDTTLLVIRPVDGDAASRNVSSVPVLSLHKLLTGWLPFDSPRRCLEHARATRAAHFQVLDFGCAAHGLLLTKRSAMRVAVKYRGRSERGQIFYTIVALCRRLTVPDTIRKPQER